MNANRLLAVLAACVAAGALAAPPDACTLITIEELNSIAAGTATKISPRKSGNPSECAFEDSRRAAVLVVQVTEVQYAAGNQLQHERERSTGARRNGSRAQASARSGRLQGRMARKWIDPAYRRNRNNQLDVPDTRA